jgi:hypothetical protein
VVAPTSLPAAVKQANEIRHKQLLTDICDEINDCYTTYKYGTKELQSDHCFCGISCDELLPGYWFTICDKNNHVRYGTVRTTLNKYTEKEQEFAMQQIEIGIDELIKHQRKI